MTQATLEQAQISGPARDARGRLLPGHGMGRPVGAKGKAGSGHLARLHERADAAWAVVDERLSQSCPKTALFILQRLLPAERTVEVPGGTARDWAEALAAGDLTAGEAQRAATALRALADTDELKAIKARLDELETILAARVDGRLCRS